MNQHNTLAFIIQLNFLFPWLKLVAHMESVYGKSDISEFGMSNLNDLVCKCNLISFCNLADVIDFMAGNTSYSSLLQTWEDWRKKTGQLIRQNYTDLLAINNQTAKMNGIACSFFKSLKLVINSLKLLAY